MDIFQCIIPQLPKEDEYDDDGYAMARHTRSMDRDVVRSSGRMRERRPSLPGTGTAYRTVHYATAPVYYQQAPLIRRHSRSRTLLPPSPATLNRARGPTPERHDRSVSVTSEQRLAKPSFLPMTRKADMRHPELSDYLAKPRLVSTLGCHAVRPWRAPSPPPNTLKRQSVIPEFRNLRLGGFMEGPRGEPDETYPEILRKYYYDTYLNGVAWSGNEGTMPEVPRSHRGM